MEKKRVLVVDDNEFFIQQEISCLGRDRFEFNMARCGSEALEMARSLLPDLILLDQIMPDLTGQEVCGTLKNDPLTCSIPIVIVSSSPRESSRVGAIKALCDGLIHKPIRADLLISIVEELLGLGERRLERASLYLPCTVLKENVRLSARLLSLSGEGAFVDMVPLPITGDMFEIRFTIPAPEKAVCIRSAAVVWTGRLGKTGHDGAGMHFLTIAPVEKKIIIDYVRMKLESGGSTFARSSGSRGTAPGRHPR